MGAELVATSDISGEKGDPRLLWQSVDIQASEVDHLVIFPSLLMVINEMEANMETTKGHKMAEWSIMGWYVAHLRRHHRHHMAITCLPDRCMGLVSFDKDIAKAFDALFGKNDATVGRLSAQLSYYTLKKAVALKAHSLRPIFDEITMDEFIWGVCIIRTRVIGLTRIKGSHASFVLAGSVQHIMNHVSLANTMPPGPNTKYQTNTVTNGVNENGESITVSKTWEVVFMDRFDGVKGIHCQRRALD